MLQMEKSRHNRELGSRIEKRIQIPCPTRLCHAFLLSRDQRRPDKASHFLPLTTNHESSGRHWLAYQTAGQILGCRDGSSCTRAALNSCRSSPRDLWGTSASQIWDMTLTSQASNIPLHTWRKGSGFHGNAHLRSSQFTHPAPLLYPRHASLPVLIRASQKEYLDMQGFLPSFCSQNSHGYLGGQRGLWGHASIFQAQWTIRWWKPQWAWEDGDVLTVSNSNFQYRITIRKHNGLKNQAKVPPI